MIVDTTNVCRNCPEFSSNIRYNFSWYRGDTIYMTDLRNNDQMTWRNICELFYKECPYKFELDIIIGDKR